jgi:hypothetical protein
VLSPGTVGALSVGDLNVLSLGVLQVLAIDVLGGLAVGLLTVLAIRALGVLIFGRGYKADLPIERPGVPPLDALLSALLPLVVVFNVQVHKLCFLPIVLLTSAKRRAGKTRTQCAGM